jgi:hypothetical protein
MFTRCEDDSLVLMGDGNWWWPVWRRAERERCTGKEAKEGFASATPTRRYKAAVDRGGRWLGGGDAEGGDW